MTEGSPRTESMKKCCDGQVFQKENWLDTQRVRASKIVPCPQLQLNLNATVSIYLYNLIYIYTDHSFDFDFMLIIVFPIIFIVNSYCN